MFSKKRIRKTSFSLKCFYILLVSLLVVNVSMARYRTTYTMGIVADTANFVFRVNGHSDLASLFTVNLADTVQATEQFNYQNRVLAPGANGTFNIILDCRNSEMDVSYSIKVYVDENDILPDEMVFFTDSIGGGATNIINQAGGITSIEGTIPLEDIEQNELITIPVRWIWQVNKDIAESNFEGETFKVNVEATAKQIIN